MNRRQKLALWVGGILVSALLTIQAIEEHGGHGYDYQDFIIPVLIITGLLFITFKKD